MIINIIFYDINYDDRYSNWKDRGERRDCLNFRKFFSHYFWASVFCVIYMRRQVYLVARGGHIMRAGKLLVRNKIYEIKSN